jgi:phage shock protein PspC (stress-responsive transcriptional regulator)
VLEAPPNERLTMDVLLQSIIAGVAGGVGSSGTAATKPTPNKQGWLNTIAGVVGGVGGNFALGGTITDLLNGAGPSTSTVQTGTGSGIGGLIGGIVLSLVVAWIQKRMAK